MNRTFVTIGFLAAFAMKAIGASWDASYHFKYLRELTQWPHLVNAFGNTIAIVLLILLWRRTEPSLRKPLKVILTGVGVFLVAIPFDDWWHRVFGIDLTTWSPSHFSLYLGTMLMIIGVIVLIEQYYRLGAISSKLRIIAQMLMSAYLMEAFWFPLLQQEQGVIAYHLFVNGTPIASEEILVFLTDPTSQIYGGIPDWLYGLYACFSALFVFRWIKCLGTVRFSSLATAAVYVGFRAIMNTIYHFTTYQESTVPYFLLLAGLIFDLVFHASEQWRKTRVILLVPAVVACVYAVSFIKTSYPIHPPMPQAFLPVAVVTGLAGYWFASFLVAIQKSLTEQSDGFKSWYTLRRFL